MEKFEISRDDAKILIPLYERKVREAQIALVTAQEIFNDSNSRLSYLRNIAEAENLKKENRIKLSDLLKDRRIYDKNWSWTDKISYILKTCSHVLTSKEIQQRIEEIEPDLKEKESTYSSVSGTLSRQANNGLYNRYGIGNRIRYGLAEWWDEEGELKLEYS